MKPDSNSEIQFIHLQDKMINLRHVKKIALKNSSLEVTVQEGEGEVSYFLHSDAGKVFHNMQRLCINYAQ